MPSLEQWDFSLVFDPVNILLRSHVTIHMDIREMKAEFEKGSHWIEDKLVIQILTQNEAGLKNKGFLYDCWRIMRLLEVNRTVVLWSTWKYKNKESNYFNPLFKASYYVYLV